MAKNVEKITARDVDFAKWYTDVCIEAELMSYSQAQGFIIYRPYGFKIWELIKEYLNKQILKTGHENVYLPLVIPKSLFEKEKEHIDGFAPETATITTTGKQDLQEHLIVRPTSEVLFADHFKNIINSYRDLPKKYNQWCSVVRWEKTTRPFLRGKEFLWQEGHTCHKNEQEARQETLKMLNVYNKMGKDLLAIPFIIGKKTEKEKFAGAQETYSIEALMHDGKALQSGTSHYFGNGFSKAFDITFTDETNKLSHVYQTSWGVTTRLIGAVIMVHGDDNGLVLPPKIAPIQVVCIPILQDKINKQYFKKVEKIIKSTNKRVLFDLSDKRPGWKFSEYEMKGVPLRVEFGPRDIENNKVILVKRNTLEKKEVLIDNLKDEINKTLKEIHQEMLEKAQIHLNNNIKTAHSYQEFKELIEKGGYVKMNISGQEAEIIIKQDTQATARVIPFEQDKDLGICPVTKKKAIMTVLFAKAY